MALVEALVVALAVAVACGKAVVVVELAGGCVLPGPGTMPCSLLSMTAVTARRIVSRESEFVAGMLVEGAEEVVVVTVADVVAMNSREF